MQVTVEAGEGLERRMTVELPADEISSAVDQRLQQFARSARLPGFRPGKVPMKLLRQRYNEQLHEEVLSDFLRSSFSEVLERESLRPAGTPNIDFEIDIPGQRFAYIASFDVMPEITLASLDGREVKRPVSEVTEADVDEMLEVLRNQHKRWEPTERACQMDDQVTISFSVSIDGEPFPQGSESDMELVLGEERMMPAFEEALVGACAGEQRGVDVHYPEDHHAKQFAGKTLHFDVTLGSVCEPVLPELNEDFARQLGIADGGIEALRADVRANMERELKQRLEARTKDAVMEVLLEANPLDLPRALIEQEIASMKHDLEQSLRGQSLPGLPDSLFEPGARRRVALGLLVGEFIRQHELTVDQERLEQLLQDLAASYEDPQEVIDYYKSDRSRLSALESVVLEAQVVDQLLEQLRVEDEVLSFKQATQRHDFNDADDDDESEDEAATD